MEVSELLLVSMLTATANGGFPSVLADRKLTGSASCSLPWSNSV